MSFSECLNAFHKKMWDIFEVTHEGTTDVKRVRKHALIQAYIKMQQGESIFVV